jgi:hypothetical protein
MTELIDVLRELSVGRRVAEEEADELAAYFVETDQFRRILSGDVDVVFGTKGAGKSAIYASLLSRADDLFDRGVTLIAGELPRGAPAFSDIVAQPPTSENEFIGLWKLYVLSLVNEVLEDYDVKSQGARLVRDQLAAAGLVKPRRGPEGPRAAGSRLRPPAPRRTGTRGRTEDRPGDRYAGGCHWQARPGRTVVGHARRRGPLGR